jgi:hypothetical protein
LTRDGPGVRSSRPGGRPGRRRVAGAPARAPTGVGGQPRAGSGQDRPRRLRWDRRAPPGTRRSPRGSAIRAFRRHRPRCLLPTLALLVAAFAPAAFAAGRICTSDDTLLFGNRAVGTTTTATATVGNCGDAPWSFTDVSVHPATGPAFAVSTSCATGATLAPGEGCSIAVRFAPLGPGQTSGALWLRNTTTTPDQLLTFYGRGVDAQSGSATLAFEPASVAFAAQRVGSESAPVAVRLRNLGPAKLTLTAIVLNGPDVYDFIGLDETCDVGVSIAPGAACQISLFFLPQAEGTRRANLVIDSPQLAALSIMAITGAATAPAPALPVVEYRDAARDHYFVTASAAEIAALDARAVPGWVRTGFAFHAQAQPGAGTNPVCRYYMPPPQDSHFLSAAPAECAAVVTRFPSFVPETAAAFYVALPDPFTGTCPAATVPVFRLFNGRVDANHRYTTDAQVKAQMIARGWVAEGYGPNAVGMCAAP